MPAPVPSQVERLRSLVRSVSLNAYVPYSGEKAAAIILLEDGSWIPGVRVESASFSLLIPPLMNAFTTALFLGRHDVVTIVQSGTFSLPEQAYLKSVSDLSFFPVSPDVYASVRDWENVTIGYRLDPFLDSPPPANPDIGVDLARRTAERAIVPESKFPVGCVLETEDGKLLPAGNVENPDWTRIICAERNALGTALSYGVTGIITTYLSCLKDPTASPCGACRQLLSELVPGSTLWMDRGHQPPEETTPENLLPGSFKGDALTQ